MERVRAANHLTAGYLFRDPAWQSLMTLGIREWKQQTGGVRVSFERIDEPEATGTEQPPSTPIAGYLLDCSIPRAPTSFSFLSTIFLSSLLSSRRRLLLIDFLHAILRETRLFFSSRVSYNSSGMERTNRGKLVIGRNVGLP